MGEDRRELRDIRWVEDGWSVPDGDGVIIHTISGNVHFRSRCSWHQFIKYHQCAAKIIREHMAENNIRYFPPAICEDG